MQARLPCRGFSLLTRPPAVLKKSQHNATHWQAASQPFVCNYRDPDAPDLTPQGTAVQEVSQPGRQHDLAEGSQQQEQPLPVRFRARAVVIGAGPAGGLTLLPWKQPLLL